MNFLALIIAFGAGWFWKKRRAAWLVDAGINNDLTQQTNFLRNQIRDLERQLLAIQRINQLPTDRSSLSQVQSQQAEVRARIRTLTQEINSLTALYQKLYAQEQARKAAAEAQARAARARANSYSYSSFSSGSSLGSSRSSGSSWSGGGGGFSGGGASGSW